jgi:chorismate mutase
VISKPSYARRVERSKASREDRSAIDLWLALKQFKYTLVHQPMMARNKPSYARRVEKSKIKRAHRRHREFGIHPSNLKRVFDEGMTLSKA